MFHFPAYPRNNKVPCRPMTAGGLPHSEILGSKPCWRLPEAYRILKRPSSVLSAKASTIRPSGRHTPRKNLIIASLRQTTDHHTVKNDHKTIDLETRLQKRAWRNRDKASRMKKSCIARVHYPVLKPPRAPTRPGPRPTGPRRPARGIRKTARDQTSRVAVREPKSIFTPLPQAPNGTREAHDLFHTSTPAPSEDSLRHAGHTTDADRRPEKLRRKEVIQPHLPVRLPCYDLVPITSLTLDGSIQKRLGHRLRVLPTFMT